MSAVAVAAALAACTTEDTGKLCGNPNSAYPSEPVRGETATVTVASLYRDSKCETFQCLQHNGLDAYCTRSCTYNPVPKGAKACLTDGDCLSPLHCNGGFCNDDDCPAGFWCRGVQDVGPLAGQQFCVRHDNCTSTFDCDDAGTMTCAPMGCFDICLLNPAACPYHAYTCRPQADLNCKCAGDPNKTDCQGADLECNPPEATQTFPAGAVQRVGVCMPK
ncbi:MAG TPA: hypothetical protein VFH51_19600 [Myxococcota bacterium]|nr:hypothetical protein [Myxococcota bacterium]